MEGPLFERQQFRLLGITAGPFRKNEHALTLLAHLRGRTRKGPQRGGAVGAVDEDGAAEGHEPAEEGHALEALLRRDGAVPWEDGGQEEHVQRGLVVADEDGRARAQVLLPGEDLERYAGEDGHAVLEGAGGGPLRGAVGGQDQQREGGEDPVRGAEEEREVGG